MEQNRFSRQLIVLRAVLNGYSGHARLLQNDGATLEIRIQAPPAAGEMWAALVEMGEDGCRAQSLGALETDARGQASGAFDMADIRVQPEILAVVQIADGDCKLAMSGFLNGARTVNWADVRAAACDAVTSADAPAAVVLPDAVEEAPADPPTTAAEAAGISEDALWPEEIAALQEDFFAKPAISMLEDSGYTFIHMPATDDAPEYWAGVRCKHGIPVRACYAVPGPDRHTPPTGLEDFVWRDGYWTICIDAETGEAVDD